jgi:hypothetical protein
MSTKKYMAICPGATIGVSNGFVIMFEHNNTELAMAKCVAMQENGFHTAKCSLSSMGKCIELPKINGKIAHFLPLIPEQSKLISVCSISHYLWTFC